MKIEYIERLAVLLEKEGLDGFFIAPSEDMEIIMGYSPYLCERFQGLFINKDKTFFYICNLLSASEINKMFKGNIKIYTWQDGYEFTDVVNKAFLENNLIGKTIGINLSAQAFNILDVMNKVNVKFVNGKYLVEEIRVFKNTEEIDFLRKSSSIADEAFNYILEIIRPGVTEQYIRGKLIGKMTELGGEQAGAIVASGPNSGYPHYALKGDGRVILDKDIVLMDFGCSYRGLRSDSSRTVFIGGITEEEEKVYNIVLRANLASEEKSVEGMYIPDIDNTARSIIEEEGYGDKFTTRLGHGIGYSRHESPDIKRNNYRNLERNMAFTIEPGIYLEDCFGVRIEDVLIITENGTEVLNKSSKEIIIL